MDFLLYILTGATIALAVGITGVGGGSIMTPLLLAFGFPLHIAVGTDLLYAAITKTGGAITHAVHKNVRWDLVFLLALSSLPASAIAIYILANWFETPENYTVVISTVLGLTLILTSFVIIFRSYLTEWVHRRLNVNEKHIPDRLLRPILASMLFSVGIKVAFF
ncbi:MAG: putative membrane protein YfcA [Candidatus Azotimanducaceae bacterium]